MRIAIPTQNGEISSVFNKSCEFTIYDIEMEIVKLKEIIKLNDTNEDVVNFLVKNTVHEVLCDGIDQKSKNGLRERRIGFIPSVKGQADTVIIRYLSGENL